MVDVLVSCDCSRSCGQWGDFCHHPISTYVVTLARALGVEPVDMGQIFRTLWLNPRTRREVFDEVGYQMAGGYNPHDIYENQSARKRAHTSYVEYAPPSLRGYPLGEFPVAIATDARDGTAEMALADFIRHRFVSEGTVKPVLFLDEDRIGVDAFAAKVDEKLRARFRDDTSEERRQEVLTTWRDGVALLPLTLSATKKSLSRASREQFARAAEMIRQS